MVRVNTFCYITANFTNVSLGTFRDWLSLFLDLISGLSLCSGHFYMQQILKPLPSIQYKRSEKGFPWSPGADLPNTKHCLGPYVRNKIPSSGTLSPLQFKRRLKGPSDSLVNAVLDETKSMKSIPAALFTWMKMGFELRPFSGTKL